jgi:hypothetical protein
MPPPVHPAACPDVKQRFERIKVERTTSSSRHAEHQEYLAANALHLAGLMAHTQNVALRSFTPNPARSDPSDYVERHFRLLLTRGLHPAPPGCRVESPATRRTFNRAFGPSRYGRRTLGTLRAVRSVVDYSQRPFQWSTTHSSQVRRPSISARTAPLTNRGPWVCLRAAWLWISFVASQRHLVPGLHRAWPRRRGGQEAGRPLRARKTHSHLAQEESAAWKRDHAPRRRGSRRSWLAAGAYSDRRRADLGVSTWPVTGPLLS